MLDYSSPLYPPQPSTSTCKIGKCSGKIVQPFYICIIPLVSELDARKRLHVLLFLFSHTLSPPPPVLVQSLAKDFP